MRLKGLILLFLVPVLCQSQRHCIDSLAALIPALKDSSRIDCFNNLSREYHINVLTETYVNVQTDTAVRFASQAYREAIKIHYKNGVAKALQNLGEIARDRGDFIAAENYFRKSIPLFEEIHDLEKYSEANLTLGWSCYHQGKFSAAKLAYKRAMDGYTAVGNTEKKSWLFRMTSLVYSTCGYFEKAFENTLQAVRITDKIQDARGLISSPENMGNLFNNAGETDIALTYYRLAAQKARAKNPVRYNRLLSTINRLLYHLDSAIYYHNESIRQVNLMTSDSTIRQRVSCLKDVSVGEIYVQQSLYDLAIEQFKVPFQFLKKGNDKITLMRIFNALAQCYAAKQNLTKSFSYAMLLFKIANETGARPFLRDAYQVFWKIYDKVGKTDSAYKYNLKYIAIKDSILGDQYRRNMALFQMQSQDQQQRSKIDLLQKEQQFSQEKLLLQQQKIKSESLIKYILIAITIAFALIGIIIYRNSNLTQKNEKQKLEHALELQQLESKKATIEFQQQATELEMQALRAQMNPHFIFNCLSSINRYILINKTEEASDYLTKFSRLIRMALHNSEKTLITLESELGALRLYLDLERLRFKNAFDYSITFTNTIDASAVYIPPMLIQPFAENAIWHGLMHKKGPGSLDIQLIAKDKSLTCIILDNGIGRKMAASFNSRSAGKNKPMGVHITRERLSLLNISKTQAAVFNVEDLTDDDGSGCGTKVILTVPYSEMTEVFV